MKLGRLDCTFRNPLVLASGPAGFGIEFHEGGLLEHVGALTTKTVTAVSRCGNPQPRFVDCACGALNSIGLQNPGIDAFVGEILPTVGRFPTVRIVSVAAESAAAIGEVVGRLGDDERVDVLELNLSCPNIAGERVGEDAAQVERCVAAARKETSKPVLAKLPGDGGRFLDVVGGALSAGANGVTLINSVRGLRVDRFSGRPLLHRAFGGLCGPAILPVALARVYEAREAFPDAVIIGTGGVTDLGSFLEMLFAGADLVGVGFGVMADPGIAVCLPASLESWMRDRDIESVDELVGVAHRGGLDVC